MTNDDLCRFLVSRAEESTRGTDLKDPVLSIFKYGSNLYLTLNFKGTTNPHFIQFTIGNRRAVFKLTSNLPNFEEFKQSIFKKMANELTNVIPYADANVPQNIKNQISATLVQAFKTKGMGIAIVNPHYFGTYVIAKPEETYAEIAILNDLNIGMDYGFISL